MSRRSSPSKIVCTIQSQCQYDEAKILFAEDLAREHDRSKTEMTNEGGVAVFRITADDTTALRAAINTVTSVLSVHEKTGKVLDG